MKETLERYAELKLVIKEAEKEMETLQAVIKENMEVDTKYDIGNATISLNPGKTRYVYTEQTQLAEESLKAIKKEEEQLGIAQAISGEPYITCTFKK